MKRFSTIFSVLVLSSIILSGCILGPRDEKQSFIDATVESSCLIADHSDNIFDPLLGEQVKAVFKKFGFNPDNENEIKGLQDKYGNDEAVQQAVLNGVVANCNIDALGINSPDTVLQDTATPADVDAAVPDAPTDLAPANDDSAPAADSGTLDSTH